MVKAPAAGLVTVSDTVAVCVIPPPVPVTVIVYVPAAAEDPTLKVAVEVPEPGDAIDDGLKLTVTPDGWPLVVNPIAEANPPETLVAIVEVPLLPATTEIDDGEAEMVKAGVAAAVIVSETVVVSVNPPPEPVMVMG